ncbi:transposase [Archangium violaceum]
MSERAFCERLDYDLMFRFFLDMGLEEDSFDASTFAKNKELLLGADVARLFFEGAVDNAREQQLLSSEHFTVDGTHGPVSSPSSPRRTSPRPQCGTGPRSNMLAAKLVSRTRHASMCALLMSRLVGAARLRPRVGIAVEQSLHLARTPPRLIESP